MYSLAAVVITSSILSVRRFAAIASGKSLYSEVSITGRCLKSYKYGSTGLNDQRGSFFPRPYLSLPPIKIGWTVIVSFSWSSCPFWEDDYVTTFIN